MTEHDAATVWAVAEALYYYSYSSEFGQLDSSEKVEYYGMAEAALDAIDTNRQDDRQPDAGLVRWNPETGALDDALRGVPDSHMVTVTIPAYKARELHSEVMSAEWRRPLPAWARPNLPLVIAFGSDILVLGDDGRYRRNLSQNAVPRTAVEMEQLAASIAAQVRVLIDADGLHVKDQS